MRFLHAALAVVFAALSVHAPQAAQPSRRMPDGDRRPQTFVDLAYPREALDARLQGFVVIELDIDDQGHVSSTRVLAGEPLLAEPAAANARQWLFEPYAGRTAVVYRFDIDRALCNDDTGGLFRLESPTLGSVTTCSAPGRAPARWADDDLYRYGVDRPHVDYPNIAQAARVHGPVVVRVTLDRGGTVASATALSGPALLLDAAVRNAKGWRFNASERRETIVVYEFALDRLPGCGNQVINEVLYDGGYIRVGASARCIDISAQPSPARH